MKLYRNITVTVIVTVTLTVTGTVTVTVTVTVFFIIQSSGAFGARKKPAKFYNRACNSLTFETRL